MLALTKQPTVHYFSEFTSFTQKRKLRVLEARGLALGLLGSRDAESNISALSLGHAVLIAAVSKINTMQGTYGV